MKASTLEAIEDKDWLGHLKVLCFLPQWWLILQAMSQVIPLPSVAGTPCFLEWGRVRKGHATRNTLSNLHALLLIHNGPLPILICHDFQKQLQWMVPGESYLRINILNNKRYSTSWLLTTLQAQLWTSTAELERLLQKKLNVRRGILWTSVWRCYLLLCIQYARNHSRSGILNSWPLGSLQTLSST